MVNCILVGMGGFIGTVLRYLIGLLPLGPSHGFPVKTLLINVIGAFAIGLIGAIAARHETVDPRWVLMLRVGVCGGFTTFSTFAYEAADLLQGGHTGAAFAYALLSVAAGILAVFAAQLLVR